MPILDEDNNMATNAKVDLTKDQGFGFKADGTARLRAAPTGPRAAKPVFAIVKYTDEGGNEVKLDRDRLNITFEKDASNLVTLLTGEGMGSATVVQVTLPSNEAPAAPAAAPAGE